MGNEGDDKGGVRFNPVSLLGGIIFIIGLILALVSVGMQTWSTLTTSREVIDSYSTKTYKEQGPLRRCVSYRVSQDILLLPENEQPRNRCIYMTDLDCSDHRPILPSAHIVFNISELHSVSDTDECDEMKSQLNAVFAFAVLGIVGTFVAAILAFPIFPLYLYAISAGIGFLAAIFFAISIGVFASVERTFSGFFSLNGSPEDACLSHGFGLATGAMCLNILASGLQVFAVFYHKGCARQKEE